MMKPIATGALFHRGTFNGHPLSIAAGIACLTLLRAEGAEIFPRIERFAATLADHANAEAERLGVAVCAQQVGPALQLFAGVRRLAGLGDLAAVDKPGVLALTEALLTQGVQAIPRGMMYVSAAHGEAEIEATLTAITFALTRYADVRRCTSPPRGHTDESDAP